MGCVVFFAGPMVLEGEYMVNINVNRQPYTEKGTVEDITRFGELQDKRSTPNYKKLEEYDTTIAEQPAIVQVINATIEVSGKDVLLKDAVARFIKDKVCYIITYDVPEESHHEYFDCFDLVISSFKFE